MRIAATTAAKIWADTLREMPESNTGDTHLDKMLQNKNVQVSNDPRINAFEQRLLDELNKIIDNEEVVLEVDDSPKGLLATIVKEINLEELQSKFPQKSYMRVNTKEIEYSFVDGQEPIKIQL
jgi:predicted acyl esterase